MVIPSVLADFFVYRDGFVPQVPERKRGCGTCGTRKMIVFWVVSDWFYYIFIIISSSSREEKVMCSNVPQFLEWFLPTKILLTSFALSNHALLPDDFLAGKWSKCVEHWNIGTRHHFCLINQRLSVFHKLFQIGPCSTKICQSTHKVIILDV